MSDSEDTPNLVVRGELLYELPEELPLGTELGGFIIDSPLGRGGCAVVYRARHAVIGREVAVKVLRGELAAVPEMVQRFVREARIVNKLRHPAIVDVQGFGTLPDGRPFFVMELLAGENLHSYVGHQGRLGLTHTVELLTPVASALTAAHASGVVHRDLKPSNMLVVQPNSPVVVKLLDFGIAKLLQPEPGEPQLTTEQQRLGSYQSMAPEQLLGLPVDGRTDEYALAITAFYMLTGKMPFWGKSAGDYMELHLNAPPPRASERVPLPIAVDAVLQRGLAKRADQRYPDVNAFVAALDEVARAHAPQRRTASGEQPARVARGVAIDVQVVPRDGHTEDEAVLEQAAILLGPVETALAGAGYRLMLQTADCLVGARVLSDDAAEAQGMTAQSLELARSLYDNLCAARGDLPLRCVVLVHVDEVELRFTANGPTPTGGHLARITDWPIEAREGWYATTNALAVARGEPATQPS